MALELTPAAKELLAEARVRPGARCPAAAAHGAARDRGRRWPRRCCTARSAPARSSLVDVEGEGAERGVHLQGREVASCPTCRRSRRPSGPPSPADARRGSVTSGGRRYRGQAAPAHEPAAAPRAAAQPCQWAPCRLRNERRRATITTSARTLDQVDGSPSRTTPTQRRCRRCRAPDHTAYATEDRDVADHHGQQPDGHARSRRAPLPSTSGSLNPCGARERGGRHPPPRRWPTPADAHAATMTYLLVRVATATGT